MEKRLERLRVEHRLIAISVTHHQASHTTAFVHWGDDRDQQCAMGSGDTFDKALAVALKEMVGRRVMEEPA